MVKTLEKKSSEEELYMAILLLSTIKVDNYLCLYGKIKDINKKVNILTDSIQKELESDKLSEQTCVETSTSIDVLIANLGKLTLELKKENPESISNWDSAVSKVKEKTWSLLEAINEYSTSEYAVSLM